jgi:peptidyl-prolyl cis-trans isomerase C
MHSFHEAPVKHRLSLFVLLALVVVACQKTPATPPAAASTPAGAVPAAKDGAAQVPGAPPAVKPVPAQLPEIVARVNGKDIPRSEFENAVRNVESQNGPVPPNRRDEFYRALLDDLIGYRLLEQECSAQKMAIADTDVEARIKQIRQQFPDEATFQKALADRQTTLDRLRSETRNQLMVDRFIEAQVNAKISVPPQQVTDFYNQNPDKFVQPETMRARHILVRLPDKPDDAAKKKARIEAEAILKQLKAGADFAKLAKEKSQDPGSAQNGGELPAFPKGQMIPAFEQAAFALKPGQMSGVVETQFGFHIIKVLERHPEGKVPFEQVRTQISDYLTNQQRQQKIGALIDQLKAKAKVQIFI